MKQSTVVWVGRVLSALPVLALVFSAVMKIMQHPEVLAELSGKLGYPPTTVVGIGVVEVVCVLVYAVPRTAFLGAILLTGYFGGAIASHVRADDPFFLPLVFGVLIWAGLYLRDERLRELFPLRRPV